MQYLHVKNIEKYHPGYQDRTLIWCKAYFKMLNAEPEFEMLCETDKWRFIALIMLELQTQKPVVWSEEYLKRKGFDFKKRRMSLTVQMLHNFIEVRTSEGVVNPVTEIPENVTQIKSRVEKSREDKNNTEVIFQHWNLYKGQKNWKSHRELSPEITEAIELQLKTYLVEQLKEAITNYADVLLDKQFVWSRAWTLRHFLIRHRPDDRKDLQLYRFLENSFSPTDFLNKDGHYPQANRCIVRQEYTQKTLESSEDKLITVRKDKAHKDKWFLIDELRPEIIKEILAEESKKADS